MDTTVRRREVENVDERSPAVAAFFEALGRAQERYIRSLGEAVSALQLEPGQLGCVAAGQGRLTRQFFDAQRLILARRTAIDAEVSRIGLAAEDEADVVVRRAIDSAAMTGRVARAVVARRPIVVAARAAGTSLDGHSARQQVAALGAVVVRTMADAQSLAHVIDAAFAPDEPNGELASRQLTAVLDEWWTAENQEGRAAIDDAHARAAMRMHVAKVQAEEIFAEPDDEPEPQPVPADALVARRDFDDTNDCDADVVTSASPALPARMLAALDDADGADLYALLSSLAAVLEPMDTDPAATAEQCLIGVRPTGDLVMRIDHDATDSGAVESAPEEAFRRFWSRSSMPTTKDRSPGWLPLRVVLPMAGVMSAIALALAWIG